MIARPHMPRAAMVVNSVRFCYDRHMQLRAPSIILFRDQPLRDHCIGVEGDRITYILPIAEAPRDTEVIDLPHTTLLPGLVNAHCHMDLSHLRGQLTFKGSFTDWILELVTLRSHVTRYAIHSAAHELVKSGVTTVRDHIGAFPDVDFFSSLPLHVTGYLEVFGPTSKIAHRIHSLQRARALAFQDLGIPTTLVPHAPYSLHPETAKTLINAPGSLSIHCAESNEEWDLFTQTNGKMLEFLKQRTREQDPENYDTLFALTLQKQESPLQFMKHAQLIPFDWLAIHCNTVTDGDIALLKESRATVVHCPRSHRFFNHPPFPLEKLRAAGIPIAIGTDSLASCPNFDFLEELRAMREEFSFLTTNDILSMATCQAGGAGVILRQGDPGGGSVNARLTKPSTADIIGLPSQNDLLHGPVTFSMIGGRRVI